MATLYLNINPLHAHHIFTYEYVILYLKETISKEGILFPSVLLHQGKHRQRFPSYRPTNINNY